MSSGAINVRIAGDIIHAVAQRTIAAGISCRESVGQIGCGEVVYGSEAWARPGEVVPSLLLIADKLAEAPRSHSFALNYQDIIVAWFYAGAVPPSSIPAAVPSNTLAPAAWRRLAVTSPSCSHTAAERLNGRWCLHGGDRWHLGRSSVQHFARRPPNQGARGTSRSPAPPAPR